MAQTLHTFIGENPAGVGRVFFGASTPVAPDGNNYIVGDRIVYEPLPFGSVATPGSPVVWICTAGGVGGTAQWLAIGASQGILSTALANAIGVASLIGAGSDTILKFTIPFSAVPAGASPVQITLFTPPAKSLINQTVTKHSVAFSGGGVTAMTVAVGTAGSAARYAVAFDIFQAVAGNTFEINNPGTIDSWTVPAAVVATFTSTGAAPNAATAGSVDIYVWVNSSIF